MSNHIFTMIQTHNHQHYLELLLIDSIEKTICCLQAVPGSTSKLAVLGKPQLTYTKYPAVEMVN